MVGYFAVWGVCSLSLQAQEHHGLFPAPSLVTAARRMLGWCEAVVLGKYGNDRRQILRRGNPGRNGV